MKLQQRSARLKHLQSQSSPHSQFRSSTPPSLIPPLITPSVPSPPVPGTPKVHVWSITPLSPALHRPPSLTSSEWLDAVLLAYSGAALLKDGSVVMWYESSPGKEHRLTFPEPIMSLAATPSEAVTRTQTGTSYLLPNETSGPPRQLTTDEALCFRLPECTTQVRLGSTGLMAAW